MKVLVTGAGGFIGSHLVEHLVARGDAVRAMVHYRGDGTRGWLEESPVLPDVEVVAGDVRDAHWMVGQTRGIDSVYHLAAQAGIPRSYTSPEQFLAVNAEGTVHVLEAARAASARVLFMSTSEVYGTSQYAPMDEAHPLAAQSPYATSKLAADSLCRAYRLSFELDVRVARCFNTYGPRQSQRAVVPNVLAQILRVQQVGRAACEVAVGALHATRDLTYVADIVAALRKLACVDAAEAAKAGPVNVGSGRDIAIADLVAVCGRVLGVQATALLDPAYVRPVASEVQRLCCDATRIRALTAWAPQIPLEEGIARTALWLEPRLTRIRQGLVE